MQEQNIQMQNPAANLAASREAELKAVMNNTNNPMNNKPIQQTQEQSNQLVTGIQKAAAFGALQLPARDIPMDQQHITSDETTRLKLCSMSATPDYITEENANMELLQNEKILKTENEPLGMAPRITSSIISSSLIFCFSTTNCSKKVFKTN